MTGQNFNMTYTKGDTPIAVVIFHCLAWPPGPSLQRGHGLGPHRHTTMPAPSQLSHSHNYSNNIWLSSSAANQPRCSAEWPNTPSIQVSIKSGLVGIDVTCGFVFKWAGNNQAKGKTITLRNSQMILWTKPHSGASLLLQAHVFVVNVFTMAHCFCIFHSTVQKLVCIKVYSYMSLTIWKFAFIPYSLVNSLLLSVFPPAYDLKSFKRGVSRHLSR